jgi:hypothetical protein
VISPSLESGFQNLRQFEDTARPRSISGPSRSWRYGGPSTDRAIRLATTRRRTAQLETELAVSRKVNEIFFDQDLALRAFSGDRGADPGQVSMFVTPAVPSERQSQGSTRGRLGQCRRDSCAGSGWSSVIVDVHRASGGGATAPTASVRSCCTAASIELVRNAVQLIMRELGIKGMATIGYPRAQRIAKVTSLNLMRRYFARDRPRSAVDDGPHRAPHPQGQDLLPRRTRSVHQVCVVGWLMDSTQSTTLVLNALGGRNDNDGWSAIPTAASWESTVPQFVDITTPPDAMTDRSPGKELSTRSGVHAKWTGAELLRDVRLFGALRTGDAE